MNTPDTSCNTCIAFTEQAPRPRNRARFWRNDHSCTRGHPVIPPLLAVARSGAKRPSPTSSLV
ncbi:hypothetical protein DGN02_07355 [Xanthomonas citri]|nr:hypothetical protein DGN02_07355 [Xanthomonas citri]